MIFADKGFGSAMRTAVDRARSRGPKGPLHDWIFNESLGQHRLPAPLEPLLDANRTPEYAIWLRSPLCYLTLSVRASPYPEPSFVYCACIRLLRLHTMAVEVYCHVSCRAARLIHPLGG